MSGSDPGNTDPGKTGVNDPTGRHSQGGGGGGGTAVVTNQPLLLLDHVSLFGLHPKAKHALAIVQAEFAVRVSTANVEAYQEVVRILRAYPPPEQQGDPNRQK